MKVAAYVRVSTVQQKTDSQMREIQKWLKRNRATATFYSDWASGTLKERPGIDLLQSHIDDGQYDTVVVYKVDRLGRNLVDGINRLSDWLSKGVRLVSITQNFDFDGAIGKIIASLMLGLAEMERETMLERQRAGIEAAQALDRERVANGLPRIKYPGCRKKTAGERGPKFWRAIELREKGLSFGEISKVLGISKSLIHHYVKLAAEYRRDDPDTYEAFLSTLNENGGPDNTTPPAMKIVGPREECA